MTTQFIFFVLYVLFNHNVSQTAQHDETITNHDTTTMTQKSDWGDDDFFNDDDDDDDKK